MREYSFPLPIHALPIISAFMLPNLVTPLLEIWRHQIGFSTVMLSLIFVMYLGGLAPAFLLATALSNRFGRKKIILTACVFGLLSCIGYAGASNVTTLIAARVLTGLCTGLILVLGTDAILATAKQNESHKATLIGTVGMGLGLAGGPILAAVVANFLPYPTVTVFVVEASLLIFCIPIVLSQSDSLKVKNIGWLPFQSMGQQENRATLAGLGAFAPGMTAAAIVLALMPTIVKDIGLNSVLAGGLLAGGMYLVSPISQFVFRNIEPFKLLLVSLIIIISAMALLILGSVVSSLLVLVMSVVAIGAGQGISNYASFKVVHTYAAKSVKTAISLLCLGVYVSASIIPILGGYLADYQGMKMATIAMAIGVITMSIPGLFIANTKFINAE